MWRLSVSRVFFISSFALITNYILHVFLYIRHKAYVIRVAWYVSRHSSCGARTILRIVSLLKWLVTWPWHRYYHWAWTLQSKWSVDSLPSSDVCRWYLFHYTWLTVEYCVQPPYQLIRLSPDYRSSDDAPVNVLATRVGPCTQQAHVYTPAQGVV